VQGPLLTPDFIMVVYMCKISPQSVGKFPVYSPWSFYNRGNIIEATLWNKPSTSTQAYKKIF